MSATRIAIIMGSTRQGRFCDLPTAWIREVGARRPDLQLDVLDLRDHPLPFFDEPAAPAAAPPRHPAAQAWAATLAPYDGFIFVTPEYNHAVPAVLKNAIDYVTREWTRKPAAFVGYGSAGAARAVQTLRLSLLALRMAPIARAVHLMASDIAAVKDGKRLTDLAHLEAAANTLFDELLWWSAALKAARAAG